MTSATEAVRNAHENPVRLCSCDETRKNYIKNTCAFSGRALEFAATPEFDDPDKGPPTRTPNMVLPLSLCHPAPLKHPLVAPGSHDARSPPMALPAAAALPSSPLSPALMEVARPAGSRVALDGGCGWWWRIPCRPARSPPRRVGVGGSIGWRSTTRGQSPNWSRPTAGFCVGAPSSNRAACCMVPS